ncbi:MAG TPA: hypothetical protein VGE90_18765 [Chitinophaga sp.]
MLLGRHWAENGKRYILFVLALAGLLVTWYSFLLMMDSWSLIDISTQFTTYFFGLYVTGCLYAGSLFSDLCLKREGISFLALPASQLEKLLCVLFYGVLVFFVTYTVVFYLIDIPMVQLGNRILEQHPRNMPGSVVEVAPTFVYNVFSGEPGPFFERSNHLFLLGFFSVQAVFILGPLYFSRFVLIKSILLVLFCMLVIVVVHERIVNLFLPHDWRLRHLSWVLYDDAGHPARFVYLSRWLTNTLAALVQYGIPVLAWTIAYYRLTEKEI